METGPWSFDGTTTEVFSLDAPGESVGVSTGSKGPATSKVSSGRTGNATSGSTIEAMGRITAQSKAIAQTACLAEADARRSASVIRLAQASRIVVFAMTPSAKVMVSCSPLERFRLTGRGGPVRLETAWTKRHPAGQQQPVQGILQRTSPSCAESRNGAL